MYHEQTVQLHGRTAAHELTATKDDDIVGYQGDGGSLEGRHGRLIDDEPEIICRVAHDGGVDGVEDRP